eukprot:CAMPEP_0170638222 /NCGR_PEP_ID=MMETSP0224-20130122/38894_1 /TAXON_ID=285029 /ORGANISM="Togula jolla, Strain CCCM 725" /LENGTH=229 /DNA_ID=CAMNT_0010968283 /DNA_START=1 /DNA_END=690 /DNA_ORIENTATION=+
MPSVLPVAVALSILSCGVSLDFGPSNSQFMLGDASQGLAAWGLEAGESYRLRIAKPTSDYMKQPGGWYLGFVKADLTEKNDKRDENSTYVSLMEPGSTAYTLGHKRWILEPVNGTKYVRIRSMKNGWYLTAQQELKSDERDDFSTYSMVMNPDAPGARPQDFMWMLTKDHWGAYKLRQVSTMRYLTGHRRASHDIRGNGSTYAMVRQEIHVGKFKVPAKDGRWILERVF